PPIPAGTPGEPGATGLPLDRRSTDRTLAFRKYFEEYPDEVGKLLESRESRKAALSKASQILCGTSPDQNVDKNCRQWVSREYPMDPVRQKSVSKRAKRKRKV